MSAIETVLIAAAFLLLAVLWVTLYPRPRLRLDERGLFDRELRLGWIGWDEIEGAYPPDARDVLGLRLRVRPGERLRRRLRRRGAAKPTDDGTFELRVNLADADIGTVELLQEVLARSGPPGHP